MNYATRFLILLIAVLCVQDTTCRFDRQQLTQLLQDILSYERQHAVSRRNIADISNVPGTGIFQEASSRDLDVGFAVGVKDDGSESDSVINDHSSKSVYLPTPVFDQAVPGFHVLEEQAPEALNIGLFVDPKKGISYFSPDSGPGSSFITRSNIPPNRHDSFSSVHSNVQADPAIAPVAYPVLNPYQYPPSTNLLNSGVYATVSPILRYLENPTYRLSQYNGFPYPYQYNPKQALGTNGYFSVAPLQSESANDKEISSSFTNPQQTTYPYQRLYQQPFEVPYDSKRFFDVSEKLPDSSQQPATINSLYSSIYPENYRLVSSAKPYRQFPKGYYGQLSQPFMVKQKPQQPQLILDQQGIPVMTAQQHGDRQVGAFRLRHDNGYQVLMNVPPIPTDESTDGVLVMEMKATLYRPL